MPARFHVPLPFAAGETLELPAGPARHVQVLRMQPGDALTLFNGEGGQWQAEVLEMGRKTVTVRLIGPETVDEPELPQRITLALGMPANERMDFLVEKATELGVAAVQPLMCERSVLRLSGERAERKREHWHGVAVAASEQCGGTRVPLIHPVMTLAEWLRSAGAAESAGCRMVLSTGTAPALEAVAGAAAGPACTLLSGPEGGLSPAEEAAACAAGFAPASLGPRILRADTAPLAALVRLTVPRSR
jgi:16S rRNA (uracil1498-N3)-methyltransferase